MKRIAKMLLASVLILITAFGFVACHKAPKKVEVQFVMLDANGAPILKESGYPDSSTITVKYDGQPHVFEYRLWNDGKVIEDYDRSKVHVSYTYIEIIGGVEQIPEMTTKPPVKPGKYTVNLMYDGDDKFFLTTDSFYLDIVVSTQQ